MKELRRASREHEWMVTIYYCQHCSTYSIYRAALNNNISICVRPQITITMPMPLEPYLWGVKSGGGMVRIIIYKYLLAIKYILAITSWRKIYLLGIIFKKRSGGFDRRRDTELIYTVIYIFLVISIVIIFNIWFMAQQLTLPILLFHFNSLDSRPSNSN